MEREYDALAIRELGTGAGYRRPTQAEAAKVSMDSPALEVMTDLTRATPATIRPQAPLAGANQFMITRGVRLLLVVDDHEKVLGLITATDLLGERPIRVAIERGLRRDELSVGDIMIDAEHVDVLALAQVEAARVGHVVETLRRAGRQHALVVDAERMVRGIFSLTQIARQLGVAVPAAAGEVARTFSEIEAAIR
ncbi:MAG TPA: CBS domain-containing protein [Burkholderiales bacterium]|nr:CBS domain-containing protein [Burkholderiales bacterium]